MKTHVLDEFVKEVAFGNYIRGSTLASQLIVIE